MSLSGLTLAGCCLFFQLQLAQISLGPEIIPLKKYPQKIKAFFALEIEETILQFHTPYAL